MPANLTLILNADVYAPTPLGPCHLLTGAGRILWIGADVPSLPADIPVDHHDVEGRRLIPGFIDGHAHVTGGGGESGFASRVPPLPVNRFTEAGITTVVGLLGTDDTTRNTASLLAHTRGLREEGLNALCHTGGYHLPPTTLTGSVRDDIVHLDPVIGIGEVAISDHRSSQPTLAELLRVASDAHVAGLITGKAGVLHLHIGDGPRGLQLVREALAESELPPRVFNPTHVNRRKALFTEAIDLARQGCTIDVTAFPVADGEDAWSAADAIAMYLDSDAPAEGITVSSDGGGCLPAFDHQGRLLHMDIGHAESLQQTLADLVDRGRNLADVLPAFTSNVADLLRLPDRGRIVVDGAADLVELGDHHHIRSVMVDGRWHRQHGRQIRVGQFETPTSSDSREQN